MKLLNTKTYELHEKFEFKSPPQYAILSHTWLEDGEEGVREVTYQDMKNSFVLLKHKRLKQDGWLKLTNYCNCAAKDGWEWAWMDTCCIDKTNPSDTQEAINSMFRWYRNASVCYAYLADVGWEAGPSTCVPQSNRGHPSISHLPDVLGGSFTYVGSGTETRGRIAQKRSHVAQKRSRVVQERSRIALERSRIAMGQSLIVQKQGHIAQRWDLIAKERDISKLCWKHFSNVELLTTADNLLDTVDSMLITTNARLITVGARLISADASLDAASNSLDTADDSLDTADDSLDTAEEGLDTAEEGLDAAKDGHAAEDSPQDVDNSLKDVDDILIGVDKILEGVDNILKGVDDSLVATYNSLDAANTDLNVADTRLASVTFFGTPNSSNRTDSRSLTTSGHQSFGNSRRFIDSKWFTRGWTLQELLAPRFLIFVDSTWCPIGTREIWAKEIENALGIDADHLSSFRPTDFKSSSIAMRLSWASQRQTTLEEDETYSLLGLFGINMPLIYGEGRQQAFNRFQRELIAMYDDDSVFAWKCQDSFLLSTAINATTHSGMFEPRIFAYSVKEFQHASKFKYSRSEDKDFMFSMTNRGLNIQGQLWGISGASDFKYVMRLNCVDDSEAQPRRIGIPLTLVDGKNNLYERASSKLVYAGIENTETHNRFVHSRESISSITNPRRKIAKMMVEYEDNVFEDQLFIGTRNIFIATRPSRYQQQWSPITTCVLKRSTLVSTGKIYRSSIKHSRTISLESFRDGNIFQFGEDWNEEGDGKSDLYIESNNIYFIELYIKKPGSLAMISEPELIVIIEVKEFGNPIASIRKPSDVGYIIRQPWEAPRTDPTRTMEETELYVVRIYLRPCPAPKSEIIARLGNVPEDFTLLNRRYVLEITTEKRQLQASKVTWIKAY